MSIIEAKQELYNQLKVNKVVRGAGIKEKNGAECIVIFLTQPKSSVSFNIPTSFKGNKVVTEVMSTPRAM